MLDEALELAGRTRPSSASGRCAPPAPRPPGWPATATRAGAEARAAWDLRCREAASLAHRRARLLALARRRARIAARRLAGRAVRPPDRRRLARAAALWERLGCPYERARALADGDAPPSAWRCAIFDRLGARPDLRPPAPAAARRRRAATSRAARGRARAPTAFGLTARELEILGLLLGLTNAAIAARLHISPKTVDHHVSAILAKLDVATREEAGRMAAQHGLIPDAAREDPQVAKRR